MVSINRTFFIGFMACDPNKGITLSDKPITSFDVAINDTWKDRDGKICKRSVFVNVYCLGKFANKVSQIEKGTMIAVEGKLRNNKDGKTIVEADSICVIDKDFKWEEPDEIQGGNK